MKRIKGYGEISREKVDEIRRKLSWRFGFRSRQRNHPEVSRGGVGSVLLGNLAVGAMNGDRKEAVVALFDLYRLPLGLGGGIVYVRKAGTALKGKLLDEVHLRGEGHAR